MVYFAKGDSAKFDLAQECINQIEDHIVNRMEFYSARDNADELETIITEYTNALERLHPN